MSCFCTIMNALFMGSSGFCCIPCGSLHLSGKVKSILLYLNIWLSTERNINPSVDNNSSVLNVIQNTKGTDFAQIKKKFLCLYRVSQKSAIVNRVPFCKILNNV